MHTALKRLAVEHVKPRVPEGTWRLFSDPLRRRSPASDAAASRPTLTELAQKYRTDKWGKHFYTPHYERHLAHLRDAEFTLLEIGIGGYKRDSEGGASLRMWEEFFPRARIVGLDIEDKSFVDGGRIRTYRGSQTDHAVLQRIVDDAGEIRVVVDDGSHRPEHIRDTFAFLFPLLPMDGIYAIEDTQTSYWPTWGGSEELGDPATTISMVKDLVDGLHYEEFLDETYVPTYVDQHLRSLHAYHNMVVLEKGDNREGSNRGLASKRRLEGAPPVRSVAEQRAPYSTRPAP